MYCYRMFRTWQNNLYKYLYINTGVTVSKGNWFQTVMHLMNGLCQNLFKQVNFVEISKCLAFVLQVKSTKMAFFTRVLLQIKNQQVTFIMTKQDIIIPWCKTATVLGTSIFWSTNSSAKLSKFIFWCITSYEIKGSSSHLTLQHPTYPIIDSTVPNL